MFKILAGDYGNPPEDFIWILGVIDITPSVDAELIHFNQKLDTSDLISVANDISKVELIKEEDIALGKKGEALCAFSGELLAVKKMEVIFLIETRVGNKFIAKADEKSYRRILDQSNYVLQDETNDFVDEDNKSEKFSSLGIREKD